MIRSVTYDDLNDGSDRRVSTPDEITEELSEVRVGDRIVFNDRDAPYEVVETDRYSVTVVDTEGNHLHLSQNLQSGGWAAHEDIWWVDTIDSSDG